jgi:hypothetical protein
MDNDYIEALETLKQETICWQHNAAKHYKYAREYRQMYLDGCIGYVSYEREMLMASSFARVATRNLILLAGAKHNAT